MEDHEVMMTRPFLRGGVLVVTCIAMYFGSFLVVMNPSLAAYNQDGEMRFESSCRFAGVVKIEGDLSIYGRRAIPAVNYFYLPAELLWRTFTKGSK